MALSPYDILVKYQQAIIDALRKSLEDNGKVSQAGLLKASILVIPIKIFATKLVLEVPMNDYWIYVDQGRKPGKKQPPMDAMLKHIKDRSRWQQPKVEKIQKEYTNKKGLTVKRKKPLKKEAARKQLAFLIGRSIAKKGIKPSNFVAEAKVDDLITQLQKDISEAVSRDIVIEIELGKNK